MINPYYYLFYKLSRSLNRKGNNEWGPIGAMTWFNGWYAVAAYSQLFPPSQAGSVNNHKIVIGTLILGLFVTNSVLFLNKKRVEKIMSQYKRESERSRRIGRFLVILYIVLSFALIFLA